MSAYAAVSLQRRWFISEELIKNDQVRLTVRNSGAYPSDAYRFLIIL